MKNRRGLILGEVVYISILYRIPDSWDLPTLCVMSLEFSQELIGIVMQTLFVLYRCYVMSVNGCNNYLFEKLFLSMFVLIVSAHALAKSHATSCIECAR